MSRIEKLRPDQIARFSEFIEEWTAIGLSTAPADRPRAEAAVRKAYKQAGLDPPKTIIWCGSPLSQGLTRAIILDKKLIKDFGASVRDSVWASVGDSVRDSVWASVGDSVRASVRDSVWASVRASVWASVWASVGDSVGDSVRASVGDSVGASVRDSVWASVGDSVWASVYGQHDAGWLAFYRYFFEACALEPQTEKLSGLWDLCQSAGWALPHKNICWVSERHNVLCRDERGRLHSLLGPACAYPDGWAIYSVHGVRVPAYIVDAPQQISLEKIDAEQNAEIRRVMIDRYKHGKEIHGAAAYMRDAGGTRLDHDERFGTLWHREVIGDEPIVMLEVVNSTREPDGSFKHYWLRVPPTVKTSREASAWTFNIKPSEYAPLVET
jgi:hypothetical protein